MIILDVAITIRALGVNWVIAVFVRATGAAFSAGFVGRRLRCAVGKRGSANQWGGFDVPPAPDLDDKAELRRVGLCSGAVNLRGV